jgi:hypothetical protein
LRRNCLLWKVIEGKIKEGISVAGRQGWRRRKLLDVLKKWRGYSHPKEEALDRTIWRAHFGRGFRPVVRRTTRWMKWKTWGYMTALLWGQKPLYPWIGGRMDRTAGLKSLEKGFAPAWKSNNNFSLF